MELIGVISQLGYVVTYAVSGAAADGLSAHTGISVGTGAAKVIMISGALLCVSALLMYSLKSVKALEGTSYDKITDI